MNTLTEDTFDELFNPQQNHIDTNAGWSGQLYETFGPELDYVLSFANDFNKQKRVWTLLEVDGKQYVSAGYHMVNRMGYFITEKPWSTGTEEFEIEGVYPFNEGDDYWTIENGQVVWSCWDSVSEELYDENPDKVYYSSQEEAEKSLK